MWLQQNRTTRIPFRESALPEGIFTGLAILWFSQLSAAPSETGQTVFLWVYGVLAVAAFLFAIVATVAQRDRYPWRWKRSLIYCLLIVAALALANTNLTRLLVFIAFLVYAVVVDRRLASSRRATS